MTVTGQCSVVAMVMAEKYMEKTSVPSLPSEYNILGRTSYLY